MKNVPGVPQDEAPSFLFRVRGRLCALPAAHVVEIMRPMPVEPLTGAPAAVRGLSVIRGTPIPVLDLAMLLDGGGSGDVARFVTVTTGTRQIALAVESVLGLRNIPRSSLRNLPALLGDAETGAVSAIGTLDAELLLLLNSGRLVPDDAWQAQGPAGTSS